jgi:RecB family exonuclease
MASLEDRVIQLEVMASTTENELDRISSRLENFIGEARYRFDRLDTNVAALDMRLRAMDGKIDLIDTRLSGKIDLIDTRLSGKIDLLDGKVYLILSKLG